MAAVGVSPGGFLIGGKPKTVSLDDDGNGNEIDHRKAPVKPSDISEISNSLAFAIGRNPLAQPHSVCGCNRPDALKGERKSSQGLGPGHEDGSEYPNKGNDAGARNADRAALGEARVSFAQELYMKRINTRELLAGDGNSYSARDPLPVLADTRCMDLAVGVDTRSYL